MDIRDHEIYDISVSGNTIHFRSKVKSKTENDEVNTVALFKEKIKITAYNKRGFIKGSKPLRRLTAVTKEFTLINNYTPKLREIIRNYDAENVIIGFNFTMCVDHSEFCCISLTDNIYVPYRYTNYISGGHPFGVYDLFAIVINLKTGTQSYKKLDHDVARYRWYGTWYTWGDSVNIPNRIRISQSDWDYWLPPGNEWRYRNTPPDFYYYQYDSRDFSLLDANKIIHSNVGAAFAMRDAYSYSAKGRASMNTFMAIVSNGIFVHANRGINIGYVRGSDNNWWSKGPFIPSGTSRTNLPDGIYMLENGVDGNKSHGWYEFEAKLSTRFLNYIGLM